MSHRALIVAVEEYPKLQSGGLAPKLEGTIEAALAFKGWLEDRWKAAGLETEIIFCSEPKQAGGRGASTDDIIQAMLDLESHGMGKTKELFVYLSGHGFTFEGKAGRKDEVIISSDFIDNRRSFSACLPVDYMVKWLSAHLGTGLHAYIVNACRNVLNEKQVATAGDFLAYAPKISNSSSIFKIQAALEGDVTPVNSRFQEVLLEGLRGRGRAKVWDDEDDAMHVRFSSLSKYISTQLGMPLDGGNEGPERDMNFATFTPAPQSSCTIKIEGIAAPKGTVSYLSNRSNAPTQVSLEGASTIIKLKPDIFRFSVNVQGAIVEPSQTGKTDLYESSTVTFKAKETPRETWSHAVVLESLDSETDAESSQLESRRDANRSSQTDVETADQGPVLTPLPSQKIEIVVPPDSVLELTNLETRKKSTFKKTRKIAVGPDPYLAILRGRTGDTIARQEIDFSEGNTQKIDLARWRGSTPHESIAHFLDTGSGWVEFSESLNGPVEDPDIDLWLALAGAGRIFLGGSGDDYVKLARLPLLDFRRLLKGASPIYVVAASSREIEHLQFAISDDSAVQWQDVRSPAGMPGIYEIRFDALPAPHLLSFRVNGGVPYTIATCASRNRAMLVTVSFDHRAAPTISQYLLPIGHLARHLPEYDRIAQRRREKAPLADVRFLAEATRSFRRRRTVFDASNDKAMREVLYAKWLDPITSALVSYELIRRGREIGARRSCL